MAKSKNKKSWYPVSAFGLIFTGLYALVPPYVVYAQSTGIFPEALQVPIISGTLLVLGCMLVCRYTNQKPFHKKGKASK